MEQKSISGRKREILDAAKRVFIRKGFSKTTMEDVVAETTLSKGGVYYHYKSTKEMIFDMFMEGNEYRIRIMKQFIEDHHLSREDLQNEDIVAEMMVQKFLTVSPMMEIYAQFLIESSYNDELLKTYHKIARKSFEEISRIFPSSPGTDTQVQFEFITNIMNIFILGSNILKVNENFMQNRTLIKEMIKVAIRHFKE